MAAGAWVKFRHVTVPMISPVIYFNLIMGIIGSLQVFAQSYIMFSGGMLGGSGVATSAGGPNRSALFYTVYLYQCAFDFHQMGYACAMAWILFLIILCLNVGGDAFHPKAYFLRGRLTHARLPTFPHLSPAAARVDHVPGTAGLDDFHRT